jgi:electron transfer flavoprotein alpha subunit
MTGIDVLVFIESHGGAPKRAGLEALGEGARIASATGGRLGALILGSGARSVAEGVKGPELVYYREDPVFDALSPEPFGAAVCAAIDAFRPGLFLLAATFTGREIAPLAAHRLKTSVAADVIEIRPGEGGLEVRRPVYAGKAIATLRCPTPAVVTTRPNVFAPEETPGASPTKIEELPVELPASPRARVVETQAAPGADRIELTEADVIVSGGRGLKGPENFAMLEELGRTLGAAVGASRAVCDAGWRPHSDQVGQTGKTVCPKLYIACGISGAIQHLAGMSSSKCIVAINKDPSAPIFQVADYGIVGDVFEVVPALTEKLKKVLG